MTLRPQQKSIALSLFRLPHLQRNNPMPHSFQISRDSEALFITLVTRNRLPVFKTDRMKAVLCRALDESRTSGGFLLFAYVIMPDHMHLLTNKPNSTSEV